MTTRVGSDVRCEPIPGMEVCDFCTATPVAYAYPCGTVVLGPNITSDPWGACEDCHALIEADDRDALAARAIAGGDLPANATPVIAELHRRFFAARLGDAKPL